MSDRAFVCRCEDVTVAEIDHAIARGLASVEEIKRYTGLGTGPCQGKECMATLARRLAGQGLVGAARLQPFTPRPPTEAVSLGTLAAFVEDEP